MLTLKNEFQLVKMVTNEIYNNSLSIPCSNMKQMPIINDIQKIKTKRILEIICRCSNYTLELHELQDNYFKPPLI